MRASTVANLQGSSYDTLSLTNATVRLFAADGIARIDTLGLEVPEGVVNAKGTQIEFDDLSPDVKAQDAISFKPRRERRRTVADDLYKRLTEERESFWTAVYPLFMEREITRANVREVVKKGLEEARGNYKIVARLFNMESRDYKRFLNFLRKHDCQIPFKEYR